MGKPALPSTWKRRSFSVFSFYAWGLFCTSYMCLTEQHNRLSPDRAGSTFVNTHPTESVYQWSHLDENALTWLQVKTPWRVTRGNRAVSVLFCIHVWITSWIFLQTVMTSRDSVPHDWKGMEKLTGQLLLHVQVPQIRTQYTSHNDLVSSCINWAGELFFHDGNSEWANSRHHHEKTNCVQSNHHHHYL